MSHDAPRDRTHTVCILGMHRSGTSLAASVVSALGLDLGPRESMLQPEGPENVAGYFEQSSVRELNDQILAAFGGTWWRPPRLAAGWERSERLEPLYATARELTRSLFSDGSRYAIKDPRLSLTLRFWRQVVGEPRCIVCVRSATEIAASLRRRYSVGPQRSRRPWHPLRRQNWEALTAQYAESASAETALVPRVTISFDEWFTNPAETLHALAGFLGLPVGPELAKEVTTLVKPGLRHQHSPAG